MYCKHRKYKWFGPCKFYKRGCSKSRCSYMKQKKRKMNRDKRKQDKALVISSIGNKKLK